MKAIKQYLHEWSLFQQIVAVLLTVCTILLAAYVGLAWFYFSTMTRDIAVLAANQAEAGRTFHDYQGGAGCLGSRFELDPQRHKKRVEPSQRKGIQI